MRSTLIVAMFAGCPLALADGSHLRFTQQHGFTFSEIGDPGNPDYAFKEFPGDDFEYFGGVDRTYRMSTTEMTGGQWHEFVLAYAPYVGDQWNTSTFGGNSHWIGDGADGVPQYTLFSDPQARVQVGWRFAARYCNWLHNGKPTGPDVPQWIFETGAYDTSTFTSNPDGSVNDQATRSPGAKFWIPSRDEWVKAAYWDPNRYGEGQGGYWEQPYASDDPAATGPASQGGETNAGPIIEGTGYLVGSYADADAPWGLLDVSGGESEWLEDFQFGYPRDRLRKGSWAGMGEFYYLFDEIQTTRVGAVTGSLATLRIAAVVPSPSATTILLAAPLFASGRRRARTRPTF
ncbi:MAG: hypothetical protein ACTS27_06065 [Phycisphaerales bacterium]